MNFYSITVYLNFYAKAYWLWNQEGWIDLNTKIIENFQNIYNRSGNSDDVFDKWYQEQIIKAEKELKLLR